MLDLRRSLLLSLLVVLCAAGCEHADPLDPNAIQPTLSSIQANVFDLSCAVSGCHQGMRAPLGLDLSDGQAFGNLVNVRSGEAPDLFRVEAGNPDDSYLVRKIEGAPDIVGERMPRGRAPLTAEQIAAIRAWIADGAQDN